MKIFCFNSGTKKRIIFICSFFIITQLAEFLYRDPLFYSSISVAKYLQKEFEHSIDFFSSYSNIADLDRYYILFVLVFFPISYCFSFFLSEYTVFHVSGYTKLVYGQGRPYLMDDPEASIIQKSCESGYGNPSGHSIRGTGTLLAFAQMFIDLFELDKYQSIIIYIIVAIMIILINLSRIILGVHSFNQVIFGDTLGFTIFFVIFHVIQLHKCDSKKFFNVFLTKKLHFINIIAFVIIMLYIILGAVICDRENEDEYKYLREKLKEVCGKDNENKILERTSIYNCFNFMAYFGMCFGMTTLSYIGKIKFNSNYEAMNFYYRNTKKYRILQYLINIIFTGICYVSTLPMEYKPKKLNPIVLYFLGSAMPSFIYGFLCFGPSYIFRIYIGVANKNIYSFQNLSLETDDKDLIINHEKTEQIIPISKEEVLIGKDEEEN